MIRNLQTLLFAAVSLTVLAGPASALDRTDIERLHTLISDWQTAEARREVDARLASDPEDVELQIIDARLMFFEGRYGDSLARLDALAQEQGGMPGEIARFHRQVKATADALKDFDEHVSADGRFLIRYTGRDKLLIPYLEPVLRATDDALARDFGYRPEGQVVVEIYPEIRYLAAVSPLTEEEIETSGTIALCKYNRLMFTSPRALLRGYGWQDTVAHEFAHYYITKKSANTVPIWLHEGIAKFQESRWRAPPGEKLEPPQEDLLARALKADTLVTFDQMHPSMAKLPSQEAASLAFAEVHTVIDFLHGKKGYEGINGLMRTLRTGVDMDGALKQTYGFDMDGLWRVWKRDMKKRGFKEYPGLVQRTMKFKRPGQEDDENQTELQGDFDDIEQKKVRDFAHLGDLLRARSRHMAALKEYKKAIALGGDGNPVIQNSAAATLIEIGRHAEVPGILQRVIEYYPGFVNTHVHLGTALMVLGRDALAIEAFEAARGINPFHPKVHAALAKLYANVGREADAAQARASLEILQ